MSHYRRRKNAGGYCFFTVVTYNRQPLFNSPEARKILRKVWLETQARYPFKVTALCLLPDHLHCLWRLPEGDCDYSKRWAAIKAGFTRRFHSIGGQGVAQSVSQQKRRNGGIWQKRFWEHQIKDYDDLHNHVHYIHYNPVKHKLVENVRDWPWSTFHQTRWQKQYKEFDWSGIAAFGDGREYLD